MEKTLIELSKNRLLKSKENLMAAKEDTKDFIENAERLVNLPQAKDLLGFKRSLLFKFST